MRFRSLALAAVSVTAVAGTALSAQDFPPKSDESKRGNAVSQDPQAKSEAKRAGTKAVTVIAPWSRPTPGASKNGAVFLEIKAAEDAADKLLSASGAVSDNIEIHNHINDNGIMQMRRVDAIEIGEGSSTKLVPGGYHIMLLGLKQPLKAGQTFKLTLTFEKAGAIEVDVAVRPNNAGAGKGSGTH